MLRFIRRRVVLQSLALGGAAWGACAAAGVPGMDALMLGWCLHVLFHAGWCWRVLWCAGPETMRERARALREGRWTVLLVALVATAVAAGTVVAELVMQKDAAAWERVLAVVTILLSWAHVHLLFAQDYAHEYWVEDKGFDFPGGDGTPEFSEFLYVSLTVGATAQVSDTPTSTPAMRRAVMLHGVVSFAFNAAILATGVNVLAGLAGGR